MKKRKMSVTSVGGSSILTIFAVLCFIVFALLSLSTARADHVLSSKSLEAVRCYYQADTQAEEILAQIRQGQLPEGVEQAGDVYTYSCPVDEHQQLNVEVEYHDHTYQIKKWKKEYTGDWEPDDTIDVWDGMEVLTGE